MIAVDDDDGILAGGFGDISDQFCRTDYLVRKDIFLDYNEEQFLSAVNQNGEVLESIRLADKGSLLIWYQRK